MDNFEKTFTGDTPFSETTTREFKEPIVEIELLNEEDSDSIARISYRRLLYRFCILQR